MFPSYANIKLPRLVALCGNPKSGKSEVQRILKEKFSYQPVDDAAVIRRFAIDWLGLTEEDVTTQEGKQKIVEILGKEWQVRDILGTYGCKLEEMFGEWIFPYTATRNLSDLMRYSFGSVRRNQGRFYKQQGGVVIEIQNPLAKPSPYAFDRYDKSVVDIVIDNDSLERGANRAEALLDLEAKVERAIFQLSQGAA